MNREREQRLQIMLSAEELRAVDDFRFRYRLPTRAAAVRELLNRGLRAQETGVASDLSRSKDFGVLEIANGSGFSVPSEPAAKKKARPSEPRPTSGRED
jgi:hypothetical protein